MKGYHIYLMIQLAQNMGVMSKELEYDKAWDQGKELLTEFELSPAYSLQKSDYDCIHDFLETKEKTAFRNCHNCSEQYLPTPDWGFCPHCLACVS